MHRAFIFLICIFCLFFLQGASCQKTVQNNNNNSNNNNNNKKNHSDGRAGEQVALQKIAEAKSRGDISTERAAWKSFLSKSPSESSLKAGTFRLGELAFQEKSWEEARGWFSKSLKSSLKAEKRKEALYMFGVSLFHLRNCKKGLKAMEASYQSVGEEKKKKLRPMLLSCAQQAKNSRAILHWQAERLSDLSEDERNRAKKEMKDALDGQLSISELQQLYTKRGENLRFPFDYVALRLARLYFHQQLFQKSQQVLQNLIGDVDKSSGVYAKAMVLQRVLSAVLRPPHRKTIGVILPLTGPGSSASSWVKNAIKLATAGLKGVRLVYMDSATDPTKASKAVETLVFKHHVIAILGPVWRKTSLAAAKRAQMLGVPLLSISYQEGLTKLGSYVFRNNLTLSRMGRAMAHYSVQELGLRRFAILFPESEFGRVQVGAFWKKVLELGGSVVGSQSYPTYTTDFSSYAKKLVGRYFLGYRPLWARLARTIHGSVAERNRLKKKLVKQFPPVIDFDAIFIPDKYNRISLIAPSLAQQDIEVKLHYGPWERQIRQIYRSRRKSLRFVQLLGTNLWRDQRLFREQRHVVGSLFCVRYFPRSRSPIVRNFIKRYRAKFPDQVGGPNPRPPLHLSAFTFDSMKILIHVATQENGPKTRRAFRDALFGIKKFAGVTGVMSIQKSGEVLARITYLMAYRHQYFRKHFQAKSLIP